MTKEILLVLCLLLVALTFMGCTNGASNGIDKLNLPKLTLEYTVDGETQKTTAAVNSLFWEVGNTLWQTDVEHPLRVIELLPVIERSDGVTELKLSFSRDPNSFSVERWPDEYAALENFPSAEPVSVSGKTLVLSEEDKGYVYEVRVGWPQGTVWYVFYVK